MDTTDAMLQLLDIIAKNTSTLVDAWQDSNKRQQELIEVWQESSKQQQEGNRLLGQMLVHIAESLSRTEQMTARILAEVSSAGTSH